MNKVEYLYRHYSNGNLCLKTPYIDGKIHGTEKWYYKTGELRNWANYKNGKKHGPEKWYYKNGNMCMQLNWFEDLLHGVSKFYHESNELDHIRYFVYGKRVTEEGYKKHQLTLGLAGVTNEL